MKTKLILSALVVLSAITFYSFKTLGDGPTSSIALVNFVFGKPESEGFLIMYGDGTMELKQFKFTGKSENLLEGMSKIAVIMNTLHEKGYRFVGNGGHLSDHDRYTSTLYMTFEKK